MPETNDENELKYIRLGEINDQKRWSVENIIEWENSLNINQKHVMRSRPITRDKVYSYPENNIVC